MQHVEERFGFSGDISMKHDGRIWDMLICKLLAAVLVAALTFSGSAALAAATVPQKVLDAVASVVRIEAEYASEYSFGSGFIVASDKESTIVATNYHVVAGKPLGISVWLSDNEKITARILDKTEQKDLCLLELTYPVSAKALPLNERGAAQDDAVFAVGFPAAADYLSDTEAHSSAEATITDGIVSAIRSATIVEHGPTLTLLQINAAISPGNSGGPLFASDGTVVGINTYGVTQGINGAIEVSELIKLMRDNKLEPVAPGPKALGWLWFVVAGVLLLAIAAAVLFWVRKRRVSGQSPLRQPRKTKTISLRTYMTDYPNGLGAHHATSLLMPVALQLRDLHNDGALHVQVSPDSVLIHGDKATLKPASGLEADRYISGFAAPEVYPGKRIGLSSDVYSFCALLYFAASGITPANALSRDTEASLLKPDSLDDDFFAILSQGMSLDAAVRADGMQTLVYRLSPYNTAVSPTPPVPHYTDFDAARAAASPSDDAEEPQNVTGMHENSSTSEFMIAPEATADGSGFQSSAKQKKSGRRVIRVIAVVVPVILVLATGTYYATYRQAVKQAETGNFKAARRNLLLPGITEYHDAGLFTYVHAGLFFEQRDFLSAQKYFSELSGYLNADAMEQESRYRRAAQLADAGRFDESIKAYELLAMDGYKDAANLVLETQYRKGVYTQYELMDYKGALAVFQKLSSDGYAKADAAISVLEPLIYTEAQVAYRSGDNARARVLFGGIKTYQQSADYLYLLDLKQVIETYGISKYYRPAQSSSAVSHLKTMLGFEDAAAIIVEAHDLATTFLQGTWRTNDGKYFKMDANSRTSYNLPWIDFGDYYTIRDGELILYKKSDESDTRVQFRFTVVDATTIRIYCTKDRKTYTLTKQ